MPYSLGSRALTLSDAKSGLLFNSSTACEIVASSACRSLKIFKAFSRDMYSTSFTSARPSSDLFTFKMESSDVSGLK